jgi:hypothetical protein
MNDIPSDEEFARASEYMKEFIDGLEIVRESVLQHFQPITPLYEFYILAQDDVDFRAYVFFKTEKDLNSCKVNGVVKDITDFVHAELERIGRGKKEVTNVAFEFDSDENVRAKFEGDYFLRLR